MDKNRFDGFTRQLAQRENRRQAIKTLLAGGVGSAAVMLAGREAEAARPGGTTECCPANAPKLCNLTCTDTNNDPLNCGSCGNACGAGLTCTGGTCQGATVRCKNASDCPGTDTDCRTRICSGRICGYSYAQNDTLTSNQTAENCLKNVCDGNGNEVSRDDDTDTPAPSGDCVTSICTSGVSSEPPKSAGAACGDGNVCDGAGVCVECNSPADCSPPANAHAVCNANHTCSYTCNPGFDDCTDADGCETNTGSDVKNCGACNNVCVSNHATPVCNGGTCGIGACDSGYFNCDGDPANGCEINTSSDVHNCGSCGTRCSSVNGTSFCSNGACGITCNAGFANCNGNLADGCETNVLTDLNNCGSCLRPCNPAHAFGNCVNGQCQIAQCHAGWADCNHASADGCEIHLDFDANNCGACGNRCSDGQSCDEGFCV